MADAEHRAINAGTSGSTLMERAGAAVADVCRAHDRGQPLSAAVLCGPGNNGGDGFVVARLLSLAGWSVHCAALSGQASHPPDAAASAEQWTGEIIPAAQFEPGDEGLIVDALFGSGLSRNLSGPALALVRKVNSSGKPVIAIDIPSGIDGNSGAERGEAIRATKTVTFARAKPGHYLYPGTARRGQLIVADIGIEPFVLDDLNPHTFVNTPETWESGFPWPKADGHKYKRGHAVVVSGGLSHTGAARMSARAALRIGAGLVTLASPAEALAVNAAHLTAIMLHQADGAEELAALLSDPRKNAVVLGPGLGVGPRTRDLVKTALAHVSDRLTSGSMRHCLFDADALTSFAGDARGLANLIAASPGSVVITPHDGEFARLFSSESTVTGAGSKIDCARAAAALLGCVVLLKGADTVIADAGGRATVAAYATPWLATAGSGDVLSGLIGGLLAQGVPAFDAANMGAYLHVSAGRRFGPGLIAEDLPEAIPGALRELQERGALTSR